MNGAQTLDAKAKGRQSSFRNAESVALASLRLEATAASVYDSSTGPSREHDRTSHAAEPGERPPSHVASATTVEASSGPVYKISLLSLSFYLPNKS